MNMRENITSDTRGYALKEVGGGEKRTLFGRLIGIVNIMRKTERGLLSLGSNGERNIGVGMMPIIRFGMPITESMCVNINDSMFLNTGNRLGPQVKDGVTKIRSIAGGIMLNTVRKIGDVKPFGTAEGVRGSTMPPANFLSMTLRGCKSINMGYVITVIGGGN